MVWMPKGMPTHLYERYQWKPDKTGLYESNYLKANSPDGKMALWLKHNILAWTDATKPPIAELWCILFKRGQTPQVLKQERSMEGISLGKKEVCMEGDGIFISPQRTKTKLVDGANTAEWDIEITVPSKEAPIIHFPFAGMYTWGFPKKKILTPQPRTLWNGSLNFKGEHIDIKDWIGFRNHNWGTEHAYQYAYGNCNHFPTNPNVLFDGFSAKLRLGPWKSPFLSAAIVRVGTQDHPFNSLATIARAQTTIQFPRWEVKLQNQTHKVEIIQEGDPKEFIGLPYHHPNGNISYCYNTKWAHTTILLEDANGHIELYKSDQGEFEFLQTTPIAGIELYEANEATK